MNTTDELDIMVFHDRLRLLLRDDGYDPVTGAECCGERVRVKTPVAGLPMADVPAAMTTDADYRTARTDAAAWQRLRCRYDFEYWAVTCVRIKDKQSSRDIAFVLNGPQRRVLQTLEEDRLSDTPMRLILLKARQWGGSTLVQIYMAWIQSCHRTNWHSVICAQVKDVAVGIRGMYTKMLANYPAELWEGSEAPRFSPFEGASNTRVIAGRDCRVTIGSSERPDSVRGADYAMAHLSETAFWAATPSRSPKSVIQAVCGAVGLLPYSLVVIESTARGVGDYFHSEWLRAKNGKSDKRAIFVPWTEISYYRLRCPSPRKLLGSLSDYEKELWTHGCASDQIYWYRRKILEFDTPQQMNAEFPADDIEAFCDTADAVFPSGAVEALRESCTDPEATGDVDSTGSCFLADCNGAMKMWERPAAGRKYVVAVDVGGRSRGSDWSVIAVLEANPAQPRVVAQWRGHVDHDILARKCAAVGRYYNTAFLVIESNTFETGAYGETSDSNLFILSRLAESYPNIYRRRSYDTLTGTPGSRVGFHTNSSTKSMLINGLIEAVREGRYVERDQEACNEYLSYMQMPNGSYGARAGRHDDIVMTRAIALHVIRSGEVPAYFGRHDFGQQESW